MKRLLASKKKATLNYSGLIPIKIPVNQIKHKLFQRYVFGNFIRKFYCFSYETSHWYKILKSYHRSHAHKIEQGLSILVHPRNLGFYQPSSCSRVEKQKGSIISISIIARTNIVEPVQKTKSPEERRTRCIHNFTIQNQPSHPIHKAQLSFQPETLSERHKSRAYLLSFKIHIGLLVAGYKLQSVSASRYGHQSRGKL